MYEASIGVFVPFLESLSDLLSGTEPLAVVPSREKVVAAGNGDAAADAEEEDEGVEE